MAVNLLRGQKISLNKDDLSLKDLAITLGWQLNSVRTGEMLLDLDISAFLLTAAGKVEGAKDFVFYGNLRHPSGAVVLNNNVSRKSNTFGIDDCSVSIGIDLSLIPPSVMRIALTATIYEAEARRQSFALVKNPYILIDKPLTKERIMGYYVNDVVRGETALVFGEIYRNKQEWKFNAMGSGFQGGLAALCGNYGVEVG